MTIREEAEQILGIKINDGAWQRVRKILAVDNRFDSRKQQEMIMLTCQHIEEIERKELELEEFVANVSTIIQDYQAHKESIENAMKVFETLKIKTPKEIKLNEVI